MADEKKTKKGPGVSDSKNDGQGRDVIDSSDFKLNKDGKKYKAHKIVFNKGEDDGKQSLGEEGTGNLKPGWMLKKDPELAKKLKDKIALAKTRNASCGDKSAGKSVGEELKGNQHKLDKNKNGELDADDFKKLRKEEMTDDQMKKREDYVKGMKKKYSDFVKRYGTDRAKNVMYATATKMAMKEEAEEQLEEATDTKKIDPKTGKVVSWKHEGDWKKNDKKNPEGKVHNLAGQALKKSKELAKEEVVDEGWDDMIKARKAREAMMQSKDSTKTNHDVKKISTGTVYTKQFDKDGMSKGTGAPAPEQKRGRGRPKKDKFAEAYDFLMQLENDQFDDLMSEGFDAFYDAYLSVDEE